MKAIVCELCGGNELIKQDGFYVCQHCRTKYTIEEAKKLFVEIDGPVEVKGTVKIEKAGYRNVSLQGTNLYKFDLYIDGVNQGDYGWTESFVIDDGPHNLYCMQGDTKSNVVSIVPGKEPIALKLSYKPGFFASKLILSVENPS